MLSILRDSFRFIDGIRMSELLIVQGDARRIPLADGVVQCVVTSPPYWGLRKYAGAQDLIWRAELGNGIRTAFECEHKMGWGNYQHRKRFEPRHDGMG